MILQLAVLLCLSLQPDTRLRRAELSKASEDLDQQFATALASSAQVVSTFDFTNCCKAVPNCRNVAVLFHTESKTPFCSTHSIQGKSRPYKMKVPKEKTVLLDQTDSWFFLFLRFFQITWSCTNFTYSTVINEYLYFLLIAHSKNSCKIYTHPCVSPNEAANISYHDIYSFSLW